MRRRLEGHRPAAAPAPATLRSRAPSATACRPAASPCRRRASSRSASVRAPSSRSRPGPCRPRHELLGPDVGHGAEQVGRALSGSVRSRTGRVNSQPRRRGSERRGRCRPSLVLDGRAPSRRGARPSRRTPSSLATRSPAEEAALLVVVRPAGRGRPPGRGEAHHLQAAVHAQPGRPREAVLVLAPRRLAELQPVLLVAGAST